LLLVPGTAFLTGGSAIWEQQLHPLTTQLNQSLLIVGFVAAQFSRSHLTQMFYIHRVMTLVLPCAYFAALDRGYASITEESQVLLNDKVRGEFLQMSRATALFLLVL
jgi:Ca2+:H+ antiporter